MNQYIKDDPFAFTNNIYLYAKDAQLKKYSTDFDCLREFHGRLKSFIKNLGDNAQDEYWIPFLYHFRFYFTSLLTMPLPFNHPSITIPGTLEKLEERLENSSLLYPSYAAEVKDLLKFYSQLARLPVNPLLEIIAGFDFLNESTTALVLRKSRFVCDVSNFLEENEFKNLDVITVAQLSNKIYKNLILLGTTYHYPEKLFTSPRANIYHLLNYNWIPDNWKPEPSFINSNEKTSIFARQIKESNSNSANQVVVEVPVLDQSDFINGEEVIPVVDWDRIYRSVKKTTSALEIDTVKAKLFLLEGDYYYFIETSDNNKQMIIVPAEQDEFDSKPLLQLILTTQLETGMFILLRTIGGDDYLVPMADKFLGKNASLFRGYQKHWKSLLLNKIKECGLVEVCVELFDYGAIRAEESNVKNWTTSRNISPHDKQDFLAIMKLIGLNDQAELYWNCTGKIRSAHMRAGFRMRKLLLKKVAESDLTQLERLGRMDFELPENKTVSLSALRIIEVSNDEYYVSSSQTNRLLKDYEILWQ